MCHAFLDHNVDDQKTRESSVPDDHEVRPKRADEFKVRHAIDGEAFFRSVLRGYEPGTTHVD